MAESPLPNTLFLPIPPEYRRYLAGKYNRAQAVSILSTLPMVAIAFIDIKTAKFAAWHLSLVPVALLSWKRELRRPRNHVIDDYGMNVYDISGGARLKSTYVRWRHDTILSVHQSNWGDLPALAIEVAFQARRDKRKVLQMAYRPEDEEIVLDQVIPMIDYYREKYRAGDRSNSELERI